MPARNWRHVALIIGCVALVLAATLAVPALAATPEHVANNAEKMIGSVLKTVFVVVIGFVVVALMPGRQWPALVAAIGFALVAGWLVFNPDSFVTTVKDVWSELTA